MLTRTFLKTLATKAHQLHPVVRVGIKGLTVQVHEEVEVALTAHELIKIRISADTRVIREAIIAEIVDRHQATIIQRIGHVLVLYRPQTAKNSS